MTNGRPVVQAVRTGGQAEVLSHLSGLIFNSHSLNFIRWAHLSKPIALLHTSTGIHEGSLICGMLTVCLHSDPFRAGAGLRISDGPSMSSGSDL